MSKITKLPIKNVHFISTYELYHHILNNIRNHFKHNHKLHKLEQKNLFLTVGVCGLILKLKFALKLLINT